MDLESLKKEAEENSFRYTLDKPWVCEVERKQIMAHFEKGYLAGAEPREKRIEELETRCTELFLQNNEFAERFEKSIEIIKVLLPCCRNYPQENAEKMKQAEQFLKDSEVKK